MKLSLKHLIVLVALLAVVLTVFSSIQSGYRVNQNTLKQGTLETNEAYAKKLANTTDNFLDTTITSLQISADKILTNWYGNNRERMFLQEAEIVRKINEFNSAVIVDKEGTVLATSPQALNIKGQKLYSVGGKEALQKQKPLISKPYYSLTDRLIIFISHPIFDSGGNYLGLIGGTIYLEEKNKLNDLLGEHFYENGSYVYVVDNDGRIIYHQDKDRIYELATQNPVVQKVIDRNRGSAKVNNSKGVEMLAGYSYVPNIGWGIVSQRPLKLAMAPSKDMLKEMVVQALPFLLLSIVIIWLLSSMIASPLQKLAVYAESSTKSNYDNEEEIKKVSAWYYEAVELKTALANSVRIFQDKVNYFMYQSTTDPLTKLTNRRTMNKKTKEWMELKKSFSLVLLDIDHFKRINDTYGHAIGDEVLKYLVNQMKEETREEDIICRYGGEEFVILLPEIGLDGAFQVAERIRCTLEGNRSPSGEVITISTGIANYPEHSENRTELIEMADKALYEAKRTGRNKSIIYHV